MEIVFSVVLVLHLIGFGVVFGGAIGQIPALKRGEAVVSKGLLHGSLLQLVTGIALVGLMYPLGWEPNNIKVAVKLVVLLVIIALVIVSRKRAAVSGGVLGAIAGLSALNVTLAVIW